MEVWLNSTGHEAELCASEAEGVKKMQSLIAQRCAQGARISPPNLAPALGVRYVVTSARNGREEFWLSHVPESTRHD